MKMKFNFTFKFIPALIFRLGVLVLFLASNLSAQTPNTESVPEADDPVETMIPHLHNTRFWLSGQMNFIFQTHPTFPALYSGTNSFGPYYEKATSRVMTLYAGVRLNNSTELLGDLEDAAGAGMSNSLGLAGYTNIDVVRIPGQGSPLSTAPYLARGMIHKVFALSKDMVETRSRCLKNFRVAASRFALASSAWLISSTRIPSAQTVTCSSPTGRL